MSAVASANDAENIDTNKGTIPKAVSSNATSTTMASPTISLPANRFELEVRRPDCHAYFDKASIYPTLHDAMRRRH